MSRSLFTRCIKFTSPGSNPRPTIAVLWKDDASPSHIHTLRIVRLPSMLRAVYGRGGGPFCGFDMSAKERNKTERFTEGGMMADISDQRLSRSKLDSGRAGKNPSFRHAFLTTATSVVSMSCYRTGAGQQREKGFLQTRTTRFGCM